MVQVVADPRYPSVDSAACRFALLPPPLLLLLAAAVGMLAPAQALIELMLGGVDDSAVVPVPAYATSLFLGAPVAGDFVAGPIRVYRGDPCDAHGLRRLGNVSGAVVVLVESITCPPFVPYDIFAPGDPVAIVCNVTLEAGKHSQLRSLYEGSHRPNGRPSNPLYVDMLWADPDLDPNWVRDGVRARVRADLSPWVEVMRQSWFQFGVRWFPLIVYLIASTMSIVYLIRHVRLVRDKAARHHPTAAAVTWCGPRSVTLVHVALAIGVVKNVTMMFCAGLGAFESGPAMPLEVQLFLVNHLIGLENSITAITARLWHQIVMKTDSQASSIGSATIAVAISTLAIGSDLTISLLLATYQGMTLPGEKRVVAALVNVVMTLIAAVYLITILGRFRLNVMRSTRSSLTPTLQAFTLRLSRLTIGLALTMVAYVLTIAAYGASTTVQKVPGPHLFVVCCLNLVMPIRSCLSISILQPRGLGRRSTGSLKPRSGVRGRLRRLLFGTACGEGGAVGSIRRRSLETGRSSAGQVKDGEGPMTGAANPWSPRLS